MTDHVTSDEAVRELEAAQKLYERYLEIARINEIPTSEDRTGAAPLEHEDDFTLDLASIRWH